MAFVGFGAPGAEGRRFEGVTFPFPFERLGFSDGV